MRLKRYLLRQRGTSDIMNMIILEASSGSCNFTLSRELLVPSLQINKREDGHVCSYVR